MPDEIPDHLRPDPAPAPRPAMGGVWEQQEDGTLKPVEGPAKELASGGVLVAGDVPQLTPGSESLITRADADGLGLPPAEEE